MAEDSCQIRRKTMAKDKVRFGLSNIHIGTYTVGDNGTVTLGESVAQEGAVNLTLDPESEENVFYADNVRYYVTNQDNGFSGSMEVAKFDDAIKTAFLGYVALDGGGIAHVKGASKPKVYIAAQAEGDAQGRRFILYNVTLGQIQFEAATTEDTVEPATETIDITVTGDNKTGITMAEYPKDATAYNTLFTNPPVPALPAGE